MTKEDPIMSPKNKKNKEVLEIIESILENCNNREILTTSLLQRSLTIVKILGIEDENKWILYEIEGYLPGGNKLL